MLHRVVMLEESSNLCLGDLFFPIFLAISVTPCLDRLDIDHSFEGLPMSVKAVVDVDNSPLLLERVRTTQ